MKSKKGLENLYSKDFKEFRNWFENYDTIEFEEDVKNGKLEKYGKDAIKDFKSGNCSEL